MNRLPSPLVVAVTAPLLPDPTLEPLLRDHVSDLEIHFTPYVESRDARAARGANAGVLPAGVEVPDITVEERAIWQRAHVVIGLDVPSDLAQVFPNLQWLQTVSAGLDHIDQAALKSMGVRVSGASGIASASIAEFVMARLLEVWKNLRDIEASQRQQQWDENFGTEVGGRTLLIAGLGSIGRQLARRARAFDMTVIATRGSAQPGDFDADVDELHPAAALDELLGRADAVVCALPSNGATTDLFNADRFALMKADSIFCNVGRGTLVVEADLIATLESGHLRAAILDVMRTEPIPEGDPLWAAPRVYLSPHSAVSLDHYVTNAWQISADNLRRLVAGERLQNEV